MAGLTVASFLDRSTRLDPPEGLRRWVPEPLRDLDPVSVLRVVLVACQAIITVEAWDLWGTHRPVPHLPVVAALDGLTDVPFGWVILASLVVVVVRPRIGLPLHAGVLVVAMSADQLRLQPQWISLGLLLLATGPWRLSRTLGWAHLASLWLWAGTFKVLSSAFSATTGATIAADWGRPELRGLTTVLVPALEIGLGVLAARRVTREWAIGPAVLLHLGAVVVLRMGLDWEILWWNLGLAAAAPVLLRDHQTTPTSGGGRVRRPVTAGSRTMLVAALFLYPAGVLTAQVDPYLGHILYSGAVPNVVVCEADATCSSWPVDVAATAIGGAVIPPAPRLYRAWFIEVCGPGQQLRVSGLRLRSPLDGLPATEPTVLDCPR